MIAPLTICQANLSNQGFPHLFTFHKLSYMNHIYTCETCGRLNYAKLSSDNLSSDESFAFPSSCDGRYVSYFNLMPDGSPVAPHESHGSHGAVVLDHLAADGTGLTAGELAIVAVLEVDADFSSGFHLELIHCLTGCGVDKMITGIGRHSLHLLFDVLGSLPVLIFCTQVFYIHKKEM